MTISTTSNKKNHVGNDVATSFAYDFLVLDDTHMKVYLDDVLQGSGYTVSGIGNPAGGTVDFSVAPATGVSVAILRVVPITQLVDYTDYTKFPAETHESALDKAMMVAQQNYEEITRAIRAPVSDDGTTDFTLPAYSAGRAIKWDSVAKKMVTSDYDPDEAQANAAASAAASAASAAAAAISESNAGDSETAALASENKAAQWAEEAEDVEVETGKYSAMHHAIKAAISAALAATVVDVKVPVGAEFLWYDDTPPTDFLIQNGAAYDITVYGLLDNHYNGKTGLDSASAVVVTFDNTTNIVNDVAHGLSNDTAVRLSNSGGALPAELTAYSQKYYVVNATADTYQLSLTVGGAAVAFTDDGTGTHSRHIKFLIADPRGRVFRVKDDGAGIDPDAASRTDRGDGQTGDLVGTKQGHAVESHAHGMNRITTYWPGGSQGVINGTGSNDLTNPYGGNETRMINENRVAIVRYQ